MVFVEMTRSVWKNGEREGKTFCAIGKGRVGVEGKDLTLTPCRGRFG